MAGCHSSTVCVGTGLDGWVGRLIGRQPSRLEHKADYSSPHHAEVKNEWRFTSAFPICLHVVHRDIVILTITFQCNPETEC
jgi:hypothetical protein